MACMLALRTSPAGFPMAPSAKEWEALSLAERAAVAAALPGEVTDAEMSPPEGDLQVEQDRLRFYAGTALLLESEEFIARLQAMCDDAQRRTAEEAQRREEAEQRREEAEQRRDAAEQENARLRAEIERLKR